MSKKTIFKRIALTAVSALTAGTLSVVVVPAASAAVSASLATTNAASAVTTLGSERSTGLLASDGSGTTGTATLLSSGTLVVIGVGDTSLYTAMTVTGGVITGATAETSATAHTTNATGTYIYATSADKDLSVAFKFASGSSSMTIQIYENAAASTTSGTLRGQWVVTAATSSVAGVYSPTYSRVNSVIVGGSNTTQVNGVDEPDSQAIANGGRGMINFILKDAYGTELADDGAVVISASNGGLVAYNSTVGTATALASITNVSAVTNNNTGAITVKQSVANKPLTTTVTISYNGVVVGTKTLTFAGEVAKVVVDSNLVSRAGGSRTDQFRVKYFDAADNRLYPSDDTTMTTVVSSTLNAFITAASVGTTGNSSTTAAAKGDLTCAGTAATGANAGSADLQLQYVNASGTIVKSNVWKHTCAGDAVTYKASFDKAVYKPGEIATLTVSGFDATGKPTHAAADNMAASSYLIACVGCPNSSTAITAPAATDVAGGRDSGNAAGTVTYKYVVGTTEGDFVAVVEANEILRDSLGLATKQTIAYSVKATAGVTNAEVLAAIVKLIASINKQIRQLQKQIRR